MKHLHCDDLHIIPNLTFSFVATLGNLLAIRALWKASSIPATVKKLFLSLAFTGLVVGVYGQPVLGVISAVILEDSAKGNYNFDFLCPSALTVNILSTYFLATASFLTISAIALDRFLAVALHLRHQELVTEKRDNIAISVLWFTSGSFCDNSSIFPYIQGCAISSEPNTEPTSESEWPSSGNIPRQKVGIQCFLRLHCFSRMLSFKYMCFYFVNS